MALLQRHLYSVIFMLVFRLSIFHSLSGSVHVLSVFQCSLETLWIQMYEMLEHFHLLLLKSLSHDERLCLGHCCDMNKTLSLEDSLAQKFEGAGPAAQTAKKLMMSKTLQM